MSFLYEWFNNPKWWFCKNKDIDSYLLDKYEYLLNIDISKYNII